MTEDAAALNPPPSTITTTSNTSSVGYRYAEQHNPPQPTAVSDVAATTFDHIFEVDARLMQRWVLQQEFPNWDSLRIMNSRRDHLDWMHRHFASRVITGSEILSQVDTAGRES